MVLLCAATKNRRQQIYFFASLRNVPRECNPLIFPTRACNELWLWTIGCGLICIWLAWIIVVILGLSQLAASLTQNYLPKCFVLSCTLYQNNVLMLEMMVINKFSDCLRTNHFWASVQYSEASWSEILNLWFRILKDRQFSVTWGGNCWIVM